MSVPLQDLSPVHAVRGLIWSTRTQPSCKVKITVVGVMPVHGTSRHFVDTHGPGGVCCLCCSANAPQSVSMVFKPGELAEGACRRFIAQLSWAMVTTCYCAAWYQDSCPCCFCMPNSPTLVDRQSACSLLIVPFCDTDASVLFRISSLAVCFAVDICTWQTVAVTNGAYSTSCMQHVLRAGRTQLQDRGHW